jgi:hypothetical protein
MKKQKYKYNAIWLPANKDKDPSKFGFKSYGEAEAYMVSCMCPNCREEYYKPDGYSPCDGEWLIEEIELW